MKWEYISIGIPGFTKMVDVLNVMGDNGWELCAGEFGCLYFKRQMKQDESVSEKAESLGWILPDGNYAGRG